MLHKPRHDCSLKKRKQAERTIQKELKAHKDRQQSSWWLSEQLEMTPPRLVVCGRSDARRQTHNSDQSYRCCVTDCCHLLLPPSPALLLQEGQSRCSWRWEVMKQTVAVLQQIMEVFGIYSSMSFYGNFLLCSQHLHINVCTFYWLCWTNTLVTFVCKSV